MPQEFDELRNLLKSAIINQSVDGFCEDYRAQHGTVPPKKSVLAIRKWLEKDPNIDRQVEEMIRKVLGSEDQNSILFWIGAGLLLAVAASIFATLFWEFTKLWAPSFALLFGTGGFTLIFHRRTIPFLREHPLPTWIILALLLTLSVVIRYMISPLLFQSG